MVGLPVANDTDLTPVGLGLAAATPPNEAQVPRQRTDEALLARAWTAVSMVTSLPFSVQTKQLAPPNAVGTPPSTTRMKGPFATISAMMETAVSPAAAMRVG